MKKLLTVLFALLMIFGLVGCGNNKTADTEPDVVEPSTEIVGGFVDAEDGTLTDELTEMFNTAVGDLFGATYEPVELVATQVVAGTNYKFLANGTKTTNPVTKGTYYVTIYKDLQGNVSIKDIEVIEESQETIDYTKLKYWVVFYNPDGYELYRTALKYGTTPSYEGDYPNYWDSEYWYNFVCWTDKDGNEIEEFKPIHGNTYYYAKYEIGGSMKQTAHEEYECFSKDTLITMADGSKKKVELLKSGDEVVTFDHETGKKTTSKLTDLYKYDEQKYGIFTLHFSSDIDVTVVGGHCFFEKQENKYIPVTKNNAKDYIGRYFYNVDDNSWVTLESVEYIYGKTDTYIVVTENTLNCSANGMLSLEDGIYTVLGNIFKFDSKLKYDAKAKKADLDKWGYWSIDNAKYINKYAYDVLNLKYLNVAIGKGMISKQTLEEVGAYTATFDTEFVD